QSHKTNASTDSVQWWAIEEPTGPRLGCIALPTQRSRASAPNLVSSYGACPAGALSVNSWIEDVIVGAFIAMFVGSCAVLGLILGRRELRRQGDRPVTRLRSRTLTVVEVAPLIDEDLALLAIGR